MKITSNIHTIQSIELIQEVDLQVAMEVTLLFPVKDSVRILILVVSLTIPFMTHYSLTLLKLDAHCLRLKEEKITLATST
jgi:hypothetical protein